MILRPKSCLAALSLMVGLALGSAHAQETVTGAAAAEGSATAVEPAAAPAASTLASIVDGGKLRVGVNPEYKPFSFTDAEGRRTGVDIDLATALASALGVELELSAPETFAALLPMLEEGELDLVVAGMSITSERAKRVGFSKPYFDTGVSVMMNLGASAKLGLASARTSDEWLAALRKGDAEAGLVIAVTEGKAPEQLAMQRFPEATIKPYETNEAAAEATLNGEANLMLHDEIFLKVWMHENGDRAGNRLVVLDPPVKPDFYGIAARQGDADWIRLLDVFVDEVRADGRVAGWLDDYLPGARMSAASGGTPAVFDVRSIEE